MDDILRLTQFTHLRWGGTDWRPRLSAVSDDDKRQIARIVSGLSRIEPSLFNEATLWARAIFPLLFLGETDEYAACSEVSVAARFPTFELKGLVDGAIGRAFAGELRSPLIVVVEAKRGIEASNPLSQVAGAMLAAAWQNQQLDSRAEQLIHGAFTVGDDWTFLRGRVGAMETDKPRFAVEVSEELNEKTEAEAIVGLVRAIVSRAV